MPYPAGTLGTQLVQNVTKNGFYYTNDMFMKGLFILKVNVYECVDTTALVFDYFITGILSGALINANLGHSAFIYLALINVVCRFS